MIVGYVEPSGEAPSLAVAEIAGAVGALSGRSDPSSPRAAPGLVPVEVPDAVALVALAHRLALARRVLVAVASARSLEDAARAEGRSGDRAAFRRLGKPGGDADAAVRAAGRAYVVGGGSIDLDHPAVRYWIGETSASGPVLLREVALVDRADLASRAMPRLPFRRPVSLAPKFARAAVNLAGVRAGDRVLDPFLGTGALLAEAALLGARVYGVDADPAMVRGALRNFAHLGVEAVAVTVGDARTAALGDRAVSFDAIVTDPPYGRASASVGAEPSRLVREVLARWAPSVRSGGPVVVIGPGGPAPLADAWLEECRVPVRVHRSLTRQFCRYRRAS